MPVVDEEVTNELIARAKAGDRDAFNALVKQTYQKVHALALRLTGDEHDADDVVQDAYVRAYRGLARFREEAMFSTWLHRITANAASTYIGRRGRHRHRDLDDVVDLADYTTDHNPELRAEASMTGRHLERALALLPQRLRSVVELRDIHGMSHREIAERLDITESAAKVRLHRARLRLRDALRASDTTPEFTVIEGGLAEPSESRSAS